jgi:hypothetical protein
MGYGNVASGNVVQMGQYLWLGLIVTLDQINNPPNGTPNFTFVYSFDIVVTTDSGTNPTYQMPVDVTGTYSYNSKPASTSPFTDNFANLNAWTVVDGTWTLVGNGAQGTSSTEALMYAGSASWTDYQITAPVTISAGGEAAIVFRYNDQNNFYWAGLGCWGNQYSISKSVAGTDSEITNSGTSASNPAGTYTLEVVAQGTTISFYVDNVLELTTTDSSLTSGAIGFRTYDSTMQVGNVDVSSVTTPTPISSPNPPTATTSPAPSPTTTTSVASTPTSTVPASTANPTSTSNPTPSATASPSTATSPATAQSVATASPASTGTSSPNPTSTTIPATTTPTPILGSSIVITYSINKVQKLYNGVTFDVPQQGYVFAQMDVTINNNGYDSFSTNLSWFKAVANKIEYNPDLIDTNNWNNIDLLDNGTFSGTFVFQIPTGATITALNYSGKTSSLRNYNIIYLKTGTAITPEIPAAITPILVTLMLIGGLLCAVIFRKTRTVKNAPSTFC